MTWNVLRVAGLASLTVLLSATSAWAIPGTVRLKNGGWVEGDVLEVLPGQSVSVRIADGSVRQIPWAEVERVDEQAASAPPPATEQAAAPIPPPEPARRSVPLSLDDPNVVDVAFAVEDRKVFLIGMPRTDATAVAIRFERFVRDAPPVCEEVTMVIDGTPARLPAQHKVVDDRFATRELIQVKVDLETIKRMSAAKEVSFDLCGTTRRLTLMHSAPMQRFVAEFERNIGKAVIVQAPAPAQSWDQEEARQSRARRSAAIESASAGESYREHTGFMLRLTTGLGYASVAQTVTINEDLGLADNEIDASLSGAAIPLSLDLGGAVSPNFNIHARFSLFAMLSPSLEIEGEEFTGPNDPSVTGFMFGGGFTYYFMPANFYLTGVLGVGFLSERSVADEVRSTDPGFALNFDLGKEWWVGGNWGLGLAGRIYYSHTSLVVSDVGESEHATVMIGAVMSATLQ
jgi:hypothetical protein